MTNHAFRPSNPLFTMLSALRTAYRKRYSIFFPKGYLAAYPDVAKAGMNPWQHYVLHGKREGRSNGTIPPDGLFFPEGYLAMYPDVAEAGVDPWRHYVLHGKREGRSNGTIPPDGLFFPEGYLATYPDVAEAGVDPWRHYVLYGKREERGNGATPRDKDTDYHCWISRFEKTDAGTLEAMARDVQSWSRRPLISVLMPTCDTDPDMLRQAIESVRGQSYPDWELCIADDASTKQETLAVLHEYEAKDGRIRIAYRTERGNICASSNTALELCSGELTALLDHDDLLAPTALYRVARELVAHPDADVVYSDEDKLSPEGKRYDPYFKGEWNEMLLLACNYVSHLGVYRTSLVRSIGGFRPGLEGSQDHDLVLRCASRSTPERIRHIPRVLYHWRQHANSGTFSDTHLAQCEKARRKAVSDYLQAKGITAAVTRSAAGFNEVRYLLDAEPSVTCIIPARDHANLTEQTLDGLLNHTDYRNLDVILVDNASTEPASLALFERYSTHPKVQVVRWDKPFNYAEIHNAMAGRAKGDFLLLLNNDVRIISPDWLKIMIGFAVQQDSGAVGAKLLYGNGTIQHAGVVIGIGGVAGHLYYGMPGDTLEYFANAQLSRWMSAVTAASLVVAKDKYLAVGGMDEANLKIAFNDVDLCLKLQDAGYHNIYAATAVLYHLESMSRGYENTPAKKERFAGESAFMRRRWARYITSDPYYSPHLSRNTAMPSLLQNNEKPYHRI